MSHLTNSATSDNTAASAYVEVADEPLHKEVYADGYFRVYGVTLSPGQATDYHRHSEDTLYVVIKGGAMRTIGFRGARRSPMVFPRSFPLYRQLWLALQNAFTGAGYLPDGLSFFMPTRSRPTVHRAIASPRNRDEVCLMGIEIRRSPAARPSPARDALSWPPEYAHPSFSAFARILAPGATARIAAPGHHLLVMCKRGLLEIAPERTHQEDEAPRHLAAGGYWSFPGDDIILARNANGATSELMVIAVPVQLADSRTDF